MNALILTLYVVGIKALLSSSQAEFFVGPGATTCGSGGGDGALPSDTTCISAPQQLAYNSVSGDLYLSEYSGHRVRQMAVSKLSNVKTLTGSTTGVSGDSLGLPLVAKFTGPSGLLYYATGTKLYIADSLNDCIKALSLTSLITSAFACVCSRSPRGDTTNQAAATILCYEPVRMSGR